MQVGCGVYLLTVRRRAYLYFWHYETKGRFRVQVKEYIGPARSSRSIAEAARRFEGYYERAMAELQQLRSDQVHEEQVRLLAMFLGEGLQPGRHVQPRLADLFRDDDPEDARVLGAHDGGMSLAEDAVSHLLQIPRGPAFGVRDDHRFVDEDRDAERMKVSRADVEVAVDIALNDRGRVIVATEELTGVGDPPVRFPDADHMALLLQVCLDGREPPAELGRGQEPDPFREHRLGRVDEGHRAERRSREVKEEDAVVSEMRHRRMPEMDDEVHGHVRHIARAERGVRRDKARDAGLRFDLLRELHSLRAQTDRELQTDRLRVPSSNHFEEPVRFAHGSRQTHGRAEKDVPRRPSVPFRVRSRAATASEVSRHLSGGPLSRHPRGPRSSRS